MDLKLHSEDILPHIDTTDAGSAVAFAQEPAEGTLEARTAVSDSCITLFSIAGASIKVCYAISGDNITITAVLDTPIGNITLGKAVLNAQHPKITLGGSIGSFKAEVTVEYDVATSVLKISGKICAPFVGCKSGGTSIHL